MSKRRGTALESYKPLENKKFYLDFRTYRPNNHFLSDLKSLGALVEPFFGREIAYVITDRPDYKNVPTAQKPNSVDSSGPTTSPPFSSGFLAESPGTSASPSPELKTNLRTARGQSLLDRVVKPKPGPTDILELCHQWQIKVLFVKNVLMWIQQLKQNCLFPDSKVGKEHCKAKARTDAPQKLLLPFIKVEDNSCLYKPLCRSLKRWPDIEIDRPPATTICAPPIQPNPAKQLTGGLAVKSRFPDLDVVKPPLKEPPKAKVVEQKKYNCEICGCSYTCLRKHLESSVHQAFMQTPANFTALGQLISSLACSTSGTSGLPLGCSSDHVPMLKSTGDTRLCVLSVKTDNSNIVTQSTYCGCVSDVKHIKVVKQGTSKRLLAPSRKLGRSTSLPVKHSALHNGATSSLLKAWRSEDCDINPDDHMVPPSNVTEDDDEKENLLRSIPMEQGFEESNVAVPEAGDSVGKPLMEPEGLALQLVAQSNVDSDASTVEYSWTDVASGFAVDTSFLAQRNIQSDIESSYQRWVSTAGETILPDGAANETQLADSQETLTMCNPCEGCSFTSEESSCF